MRKILLSTLLLAVVLLSGCTKSEDVLKVGLALTLTGDNANVGISEQYGAQLAANEINENGGINGMQIELIIKDDKADPDEAVNIDNELMAEGVHFIIGHSLSVVSTKMMENAKDKDVLFLSPSMGTDSLSNIDDNFFRNIATTYHEGKTMANKMLKDSPSKILFIQNLDNEILTKYHKQAFEEVMTENSFTNYEVITYHSDKDVEVNAVQDKLASKEFDQVMLVAPSTDGALFVNYVKVNEIDSDMHLSSWAGIGLIESIGTVDVDNVYVYQEVREDDSQKYLDFADSYKSIHEEEPNMVASNAYDLLYLLKEAIEDADSTDVSEVKAAILKIETFEGVSGEYKINEYGDCLRQSHQMIIVDGKYEINTN